MTSRYNEKISIIIPAYNAENTIKRCLNSIFEQTYEDLEVIVVDDGSKDNTLKIINEIIVNEPRLVVIQKENGGAPSARNAGLNVATGDYITFLDSDDFIEPETYENLYLTITEKHLDIVSASIREIYIGNVVEERINSFDYPIITGYEALCNMYSYGGGIRTVIWDKLYRREVVQNIRFDEDCFYGEDTLFNCRAMLNCKRYGRIPYLGYTYDHRESKMTSRKYNSLNLCVIKSIERMQESIDCALQGGHEYKSVNDCLIKYRIAIYRQMFGSMLLAENNIKIEDDYEYLLNYAKTISFKSLMDNLKVKNMLQWLLYIKCFKVYKLLKCKKKNDIVYGK